LHPFITTVAILKTGNNQPLGPAVAALHNEQQALSAGCHSIEMGHDCLIKVADKQLHVWVQVVEHSPVNFK